MQETGSPPGGPFGAPGGGQPPAGGFGTPPAGNAWGPSTPGSFGGPPGGFVPPLGPPAETINPTLAVVLGIFATLCACLPGGMTAIAFAMMAKDQERRGDIQGARSKLTYSYVISIGSILVGVPLVILYVFLELSLR